MGAMPVDGSYFFIVNPKAGGGRTERLWPAIKTRLQRRAIPFEWKFTTRPREATYLAKTAPPDAAVIVVGGDGTVNETVAGLRRDTPLGIIPTGRSNDFARSVGISGSPTDALDQLLDSSQIRPVDLPEANGIPFLSTLGIGYGIDMAQSTQRLAKRISIIDLFRLFHALPRYQIPELTVEVDGKRMSGKVFLLAIGNGRYFSGGLEVCPKAHCDDGLIDICIAGDLKRAEAILALTRLFRGTHIRQRKFHYTKAHTVRIDGPGDVPVHADGHPLGRLPTEIRVRHRALQFIVPVGAWLPSKVTSIWRHRPPSWQEEMYP